MVSLVEHARRELVLIGEDPDVMEALVGVIARFAALVDSGAALFMLVPRLTDLLNFRNLAPLTDDPAEWSNRSAESGYPLWQSVRNPAVFSEDGGHTHYQRFGQIRMLSGSHASADTSPTTY